MVLSGVYQRPRAWTYFEVNQNELNSHDRDLPPSGTMVCSVDFQEKSSPGVKTADRVWTAAGRPSLMLSS